MIKVTRTQPGTGVVVDEYPKGESWAAKDGTIHIWDKDGEIATIERNWVIKIEKDREPCSS